MPESKRATANTILKYVGFCILWFALFGALVDVLDWHLRRPTTGVSSYAFTGNTVAFAGMTNGSINITPGSAGRVTLVHQLTQGILKLQVGEHLSSSVLTINESGDCNGKLPRALLGGCTSEYQAQVPVGTTVVVSSIGEKHMIRITMGSQNTQHVVMLSSASGSVSVSY